MSSLMIIEVGAVIVGGSGVFYWLGCKVDDWWRSRKAYASWLQGVEANRRHMEAEYISEITEENERFRNVISANLIRELDWIQERKTLNARATMMAQELTYDDTKKTQVIEPYKAPK